MNDTRRQSIYDEMSEAEIMVCNYINQLGLWWNFEPYVYVDDHKGKPRIWHPDFYIPDLGIYIEVVGNPELSNYVYRQEVYHKNNIPIIFLYIQDYNWKNFLKDTILNIHQQRWEKIKRINTW